jgi:hypothetical protein
MDNAFIPGNMLSRVQYSVQECLVLQRPCVLITSTHEVSVIFCVIFINLWAPFSKVKY